MKQQSMKQPRVTAYDRQATLKEIEQYEKTPISQRYPLENTWDLITNTAQKYGDEQALAFLLSAEKDEEPDVLSFSQLASKVNQTANLLHSLGITPGDSVAILLPSLLETHLAIWGSQAAGIANPINPLLEPTHIIEIMNQTQAKALITLAPASTANSAMPDIWNKARTIIDQVPSLETVLVVNSQGDLPVLERTNLKLANFNREIDQQPADRLLSQRTFKANDLAAYFHTGGTTGRPKIARLTHGSMAFVAQLYADRTAYSGRYATLCALPLFHIYGVVAAGLACLFSGRSIIIMTPNGFRTPNVVQHWWHHVARFNVKSFATVPTILARLLEIPADDCDIRCLQEVNSGAAPLPPKIKTAFENTFGVTVTSGYGMTESTSLLARALPAALPPNGSVGTRLPYMHMKVAHIENTQTIKNCETGETGVVLVKGPHIFTGYLNAEDNANAWIDDDWFNTGDMGFIDKEGNLTLTGRAKDLIIRGGHNIDPKLIEEPLARHPAVSIAVAIGQPDPYAGEIPVAYVTCKQSQTTNETELLAHCKATISERAAIPKRIEIIDDLPLTAVAKVFKPALRNRATAYVIDTTLTAQGIKNNTSATLDPQRGQVAYIKLTNPAQLTDAQAALDKFPIAIDFI